MTSEHNSTMGRRGFLLSTGALAAVPLVGGIGCAPTSTKRAVMLTTASKATAPASVGRRRLGSLEVSSVGLGVQNMTRTYQTTVPNRAQMIEIIRAAFERGVTFFDAAEAYGPFEVERLLGEAIRPFRDEVVVATKFGWNIDQETGQRLVGLNSKPDHIKAGPYVIEAGSHSRAGPVRSRTADGRPPQYRR